jgi:predicted small secreted protein
MGRIVIVLTVVLAVTACEQTAKGIEQDVRNSGQVIDIMLN